MADGPSSINTHRLPLLAPSSHSPLARLNISFGKGSHSQALLTLFTLKPKGMQKKKKYPSEPTFVPLSHPLPSGFFHFYSFQNFTLPNPQTVPGPVLAPLHGWQPSPKHPLSGPLSLISPKARTVTQRTRQTSDNNVVHFRTIHPFPHSTHSHTDTETRTQTRTQGKSSPVLPTDVAPANTGTTATTLRCRLVYFSHLFFQLSQLRSANFTKHQPTIPPSRQPTTPIHCTLTLCPAANPNPKCRKACFIFCAFFISETPTCPTPPNTPQTPLPSLPSDKPSDEPTDPAGLFFTMPAKDKSNNNSNNSHSTLFHLPSPYPTPALAHRIALSASGVALRGVVVVVAAFLLATRKKSNKNNCHFPPPPTTIVMPPCPAQTACPLSPPTHLILSQSAQLTSSHTLGQSPKNPPHSNTTLPTPPTPPSARRMPNASQTIHKTRHSAVCQLICRRHPLWPRLIPILSSPPPRWFVDAADVSVAVAVIGVSLFLYSYPSTDSTTSTCLLLLLPLLLLLCSRPLPIATLCCTLFAICLPHARSAFSMCFLAASHIHKAKRRHCQPARMSRALAPTQLSLSHSSLSLSVCGVARQAGSPTSLVCLRHSLAFALALSLSGCALLC